MFARLWAALAVAVAVETRVMAVVARAKAAAIFTAVAAAVTAAAATTAVAAATATVAVTEAAVAVAAAVVVAAADVARAQGIAAKGLGRCDCRRCRSSCPPAMSVGKGKRGVNVLLRTLVLRALGDGTKVLYWRVEFSPPGFMAR